MESFSAALRRRLITRARRRSTSGTFTPLCGVTSRKTANAVNYVSGDLLATVSTQFDTSWTHFTRRVDYRMKTARVIDRAANVHGWRHARIFLDRENRGLWCFQDLRADPI